MTLAEAEAPKVSFRPSFTTRLHVTTVGGVVVVAISMPIVTAVRVPILPPSVCHLAIYSRYSGLKTTSACSLKRHSPFLLFCILGLARGAWVAVAVVAIDNVMVIGERRNNTSQPAVQYLSNSLNFTR